MRLAIKIIVLSALSMGSIENGYAQQNPPTSDDLKALDNVLSNFQKKSQAPKASSQSFSLDTSKKLSPTELGDAFLKIGDEYRLGENDRPIDHALAKENYQEASQNGNDEAAYRLLEYYNQVSNVEALAKSGDQLALNTLMDCYTFGKYGCQQDEETTLQWAALSESIEEGSSHPYLSEWQNREELQKAAEYEAMQQKMRDDEARLANEIAEAERQMQRDMKKFEEQQAEEIAAMKRAQERREEEARSQQRWNDLIEGIQNTGNDIRADIDRVRRESNRAISQAYRNQERINAERKAEYEKKKRDLEAEMQRRREANERERQRLEAELQQRRATQSQQNQKTNENLFETRIKRYDIKLLPTQVADMTSESRKDVPSIKTEDMTPPTAQPKPSPKPVATRTRDFSKLKFKMPSKAPPPVPVMTPTPAATVIDPPPTAAPVVNVPQPAATETRPPKATFRPKSVVTGEPISEEGIPGPWAKVFHVSNKEFSIEPWWPVDGFKGLQARALCADGEYGSAFTNYWIKNTTSDAVFVFGAFKIINTHNQEKLNNISYNLGPGEEKFISGSYMEGKCEFDNLQVFVRAEKVRYQRDKGMAINAN